jgi:hypothetical protein
MAKLRSDLYEEVNVMTVHANKIKHEHISHLTNARKQLESADRGLWRHLVTAGAKNKATGTTWRRRR